jgi:branched-chain amino acid transport system permease protein
MVRFIAFCLASFFAGIAGALAAINFEIVNSTYVGVGLSGTVLLAAYIGGIGVFFGPIIGAVLVTYLQVMLSDVTEIWQLYFGLLFIVIVMFAPDGIAGLVLQHRPLWRAGVMHRLLPAYALATVPALMAVVGTILLIEMIFRVAVKLSEGSTTTFFGITVDVLTVPPWAIAAAMAGGGFLLSRQIWPRVSSAWNDARAIARERGQTVL